MKVMPGLAVTAAAVVLAGCGSLPLMACLVVVAAIETRLTTPHLALDRVRVPTGPTTAAPESAGSSSIARRATAA
jgi:hypothetical protein